nr:Chain A, Protein A27 [Vaccinia virus WR]
KREAIVKADE